MALRCPCGAFMARPTAEQPRSTCVRCGGAWALPMRPSAIAKLGGQARMAQMTPEERSAHARKAVQARWAKRVQQ